MLFKDVKYYVVGDINDEVLSMLDNEGAKRDTYLSEMVSHVIADDPSQDEYSEAKELFDLPVVSSQWVKLSVKCKKVLPIEKFSPGGLLFSGVVACPSKLHLDDAKVVWTMVTFNGGRCQQVLNHTCTHLITHNTENVKYLAAIHYGLKVVTPDWITDSIVKEEKQDEEIYHPELIEYPKPKPPTPPPLPPLPVEAPTPEPMDTQVSKSTLPLPAKTPPKLMAPATLVSGMKGNMPPSNQTQVGMPRMTAPYNSYPQIPTHHPGFQQQMMMVPPMSPMDMQQQHHHQQQHVQGQRTLRNITNSGMPQPPPQMIRPPPGNNNRMNQMLGLNVKAGAQRQPPPRYGSPIGGQKFPQQHLPQGQMYWGHDPTDNVPPEMCLLGCVFYVTDYQKIVGQEQISAWKKVIEQHGGQMDTAYSNRVTHLLCANQHSDVFQLGLKDQRRVVTAYWLNDVLTKKRMLPPWQAIHIPNIYSDDKPCSNQIISITNFEGEERTRIKQMINALGAKYTGYLTHANSVLVCKKPEGTKYLKAKEWQLPVVNVSWLSDLLLGHLDALKLPVEQKYLQVRQQDIFQLDASKIPHILVGWRNPLKIPKEVWKRFLPGKPKNRPAAMQGQENNPQVSVPEVKESPPKKRKLENHEEDVALMQKPGPKVLFTGFPRGVARRLHSIVLQLGGHISENPRYCTHVVSPTFSRTMKFFVAINVCKFIVTKEWLEDSALQNKFLEENQYALQDLVSEKEMHCSLQESLKLAQDKPLFKDMSFYISPSVVPPAHDLANIVESAGGTVLRRRPGLKTFVTDQLENSAPRTLVITCEKDIHLCTDLISRKIAVYSPEFILTSVLRQKTDFQTFQIQVH